MKKHLLFILTIVLLFPIGKTVAQDIHFSQFNQSAMNLNPANTGRFNGDLRLATSHRRQWAAIGVPYTTFSVAGDGNLQTLSPALGRISAGLLLNQDQAGDGQMKTLEASLQVCSRFYLADDSTSSIRLGISAGFGQRSVQFSLLTFDSQFNGDVFDPLAPIGENPTDNRIGWFDLGTGFTFEKTNDSRHFSFGVSAAHLNRPMQSFYAEDVRRPVLWQAHADYAMRIRESLTFHPTLLLMRQGSYREAIAGTEFKIPLRESTIRSLAAGMTLHYRFNDAIVPGFALYMNKFRLGVSYDVNVSGLSKATNGRGGPEFSLVYVARKIKAQTQRRTVCPVY